MKYADELTRAMSWLGTKPDTIFLGQAVEYPGTAMTGTLANVPREKLLEMPVNEDMQMGMTIGMALNGSCPISIYPRWNFLILAANQVVNHLDKLHLMTGGGFPSKVIVRTGIGSQRPLHPQHQHVSDLTDGFRAMCPWVDVIRLDEPEQIMDAYQLAYERTDQRPTLLVEWGDYYGEK